MQLLFAPVKLNLPAFAGGRPPASDKKLDRRLAPRAAAIRIESERLCRRDERRISGRYSDRSFRELNRCGAFVPTTPPQRF